MIVLSVVVVDAGIYVFIDIIDASKNDLRTRKCNISFILSNPELRNFSKFFMTSSLPGMISAYDVGGDQENLTYGGSYYYCGSFLRRILSFKYEIVVKGCGSLPNNDFRRTLA